MSKSKKSESVQKPAVARRKRVVSVVPVVGKIAETCERVGDRDKVAYPPFLMQYDARTEGEAAVKSRLVKRDENKHDKK